VRGSDNPYPSLLFEEHVDPANPAAGHHRMFVDTDKALKMVDSAGTVTVLGAAGGAVATDPIWAAAGDLAVGTGNDTAGVLTKGAAGGVLAMGNSAVIWNAGTSFPGSKATGDRYWRTDLGKEFYWDGTRWVSVELFTVHAVWTSSAPTADTKSFGHIPLWQTTHDVWLVDLRGMTYVGTTNDGTKYWTINVKKFSNDAVVASIVTSGDSASTATSHITAIDAVSSEKALYFDVIKTSTPGGIYPVVMLTYRLIAT